MAKLRCPYPYFGGKAKVAELIWDRLGNVDNYLEGFFGSGAVWLARPSPPRVETVNDYDHFIANFWRAMQADPERVAEYADNPVLEIELHSRHHYLMLSDDAEVFRQKMRADPFYYDARVAGFWCWGLASWIGSGWCDEKSIVKGGRTWEQRPHIGDVTGRGVLGSHEGKRTQERRPQISDTSTRGVHRVHQQMRDGGRPQLADAYDIGRGVNSHGELGTCQDRRRWLVDWFRQLQDRLRLVRVCCGDWSRICSSQSTTTRLGVTGVFLDPPYSGEADRCNTLYAQESTSIAHEVRAWCLANGDNRDMRIVLCGYSGEGHEELEEHGWQVIGWTTQGGYANASKGKGKRAKNKARECLWFSPHCLHDGPLFAGLAREIAE